MMSFVWGVWAEHRNYVVVTQFQEFYQWVNRYFKTGTFSPKNQVFAPENGMPENAIYGKEHNDANLGFLAIEAWFENKGEYGIQLLDKNRNVIHYWPVHYRLYDPDGPTNKSEQPHGFQLFADGSVIVVFGKGDVLVRIDTCGNPIWKRFGSFHHLLNMSDRGTVWIWEGENSSLSHFQKLVELDVETGKTLYALDFNESVIRQHNNWELFDIEPGFEFKRFNLEPQARHNIFHPNDIEPLPEDLADKFPMFKPGDLLVSLRKPNFVGVIDPVSGDVLWHMNGPWKTQHDPDYGEDGKITVYNNRIESDRSAIMRVDPATGKVEELFENGELRFLSKFMGVHQRLPNGRTLIVVPEEGRVVEVNDQGKILFEFYNIVNSKALGHVQNAVWVPDEFFNSIPSCDS